MRSQDSEWKSVDHALDYLAHADDIPHRTEGEAVVLELLPLTVRQFLDLGTGDGRLASPTERLHEEFYGAVEMTAAEEDPSNRCLDLGAQLDWMKEIGFIEVDCFWKWRELALIAGLKPK